MMVDKKDTLSGLAFYPIEPALPVPRPRRDREARRDLNMLLFPLILQECLSVKTFIKARGLGQGLPH